ncbi:MFS transporter [Alcaligenaceae bacterium A4P071]|nr:MFS transporter [Alcaligenaceae bacterium A4P071]
MLASTFSRWLAGRGIHYGWVVAAVAFLAMLSSSAALGLPGVLLRPLGESYGWNTEQISSALAVRFLLFGLMAPFSAIFMARYGLRNVMCVALTLVASGLILATGMTALWQLFMLWGVMLGIGSGLTALVLAAVVANRWFDARRGLVIGMLTASSATGQLIFLPIGAWLVEHYGWRMAIAPVFAFCLMVALLAALFVRSHPADVGLRPYGAKPDAEPSATSDAKPDAPAAATATVSPPAATLPLGRALLTPFTQLYSVRKSSTFWVLFGTFFICGLSTNGLIQTHFISLCSDFGLSAIPAASVLAMMGAFDFVGTILSGWLSDRYDNRKLLFWYYGLRGLSLFWLPHSEFSIYGLSLFAMFYGLDWIATVPPTVKLAGQAFGRDRAPLIFGWIFAGHQLGAATAAYGAGTVRTLLLTYSPALYAAGTACLIAAVAVFIIRRPAAKSAELTAQRA